MLRTVSWNIHHGADAWDRLDLTAIAEVIAGCDADVVVLQEVDRNWGERSGDVDQARWLADRLEMHGLHGWTVRRHDPGGGAERRYGNALLSREPWSAPRVVRFHAVSVVERRGLVAATTATPLGRVRVLGTHLSAQGAGFRSTEVGQLLTVVAHDRASDIHLPVVVGGDFNAEPDAPELGELADTMSDAWTAAGEEHGDTTPAAQPWRRVDHVWVSGLQPVRATVLATRASDHLPVVVDLVVDDPP